MRAQHFEYGTVHSLRPFHYSYKLAISLAIYCNLITLQLLLLYVWQSLGSSHSTLSAERKEAVKLTRKSDNAMDSLRPSHKTT